MRSQATPRPQLVRDVWDGKVVGTWQIPWREMNRVFVDFDTVQDGEL